MGNVLIVDWSHWHPILDASALRAAGIFGGIGKVSDGAGGPDRTFAQGRDHLRAEGMPVGGYHFYRHRVTPTANADAFMRNYGDPALCAIPPTLDAEDPGASSSQKVRQADELLNWLEIIEARTGQHPIVYTGNWWWLPNITPHASFANYHLWIASYTHRVPPTPVPWGRTTMWQFSSTHPLPGLGGGSGDCSTISAADLNLLIGSPIKQPPTGVPPVETKGWLMALTDAEQADLYKKTCENWMRLVELQKMVHGDRPDLGDSHQRTLASLRRVEQVLAGADLDAAAGLAAIQKELAEILAAVQHPAS